MALLNRIFATKTDTTYNSGGDVGTYKMLDALTRKDILEHHPFSLWQSESDKRWRSYLPDGSKPKKRRLIVKKSKQVLENSIVDFYLLPENTYLLSNTIILSMHPFSIWQSDTDKRWRTYLNDETQPSGRRLIAKSTKEGVERGIFDYYDSIGKEHNSVNQTHEENREDKKGTAAVTLKSLYPEWLEYKSLHTNAVTYIERIGCEWRKYYDKTEIIEKDISELTKLELDKWAHGLIKRYNLSKTQYYNITVIMRQSLDYAVDSAMIPTNPFRKVTIDGKRMFRKVRKKQGETEVFTKEEIEILKKSAWEDFRGKTRRVYVLAPLALLFQIQTGLRLGELCTLRYEDIENSDYIHVQRMLRKNTIVVDHTKTDYGDREVYLTQEAKLIIEEAQRYQEIGGYPQDGYIFSINDDPIPKHSINQLYRKYCEKAEILNRNSHKTRKTYISALIDGQININTVREMVGHADERTTYKSYVFDRSTPEARKAAIESALH